MLTILPPIIQIPLVLLVFAAAIYDIRFRRIPNWLVGTGLLFGFTLNSVWGENWIPADSHGWAFAAKGFGIATLIYFPLYMVRGMGAGDVKLMMAVGSLVGPMNWLGICFLSVVVGGAAGLILVVMSGKLRQTFSNMGYILTELVHLRAPYSSRPELDTKSPKALTLPHGAMIAIGALSFLGAMLMRAPR